MDLSLLKVLEALAPGPATPNILLRYGMGIEEAHQALAHTVDQGLAEPCGPVAYQLTQAGIRTARHELPEPARDQSNAISRTLRQREHSLRRHDLT